MSPGPAASALRSEIEAMIPPFLYFLVGFNAVALTVGAMGAERGFSLVAHGAATVGALIAAKAVLLVDHLPFAHRFAGRPLIWSVLWKTALYVAAAIVLHVAERLVEAAREDGPFPESLARSFAEIDWPAAAVAHLWLLILFALFVAIRELLRAEGARVREAFFGPRAAPRG